MTRELTWPNVKWDREAILEYVEVNEDLPPDLSDRQREELVGQEKMIVECHHAIIRNTYELTEYGKSHLASKND